MVGKIRIDFTLPPDEVRTAEAKLDVAASRAAEAVMRFPGVEEAVRLGLARVVREAILATLEPTHQSALAKLQQDVQKADQRADRAFARVTELEAELARVKEQHHDAKEN